MVPGDSALEGDGAIRVAVLELVLVVVGQPAAAVPRVRAAGAAS